MLPISAKAVDIGALKVMPETNKAPSGAKTSAVFIFQHSNQNTFSHSENRQFKYTKTARHANISLTTSNNNHIHMLCYASRKYRI